MFSLVRKSGTKQHIEYVRKRKHAMRAEFAIAEMPICRQLHSPRLDWTVNANGSHTTAFHFNQFYNVHVITMNDLPLF